MRDTGPERFFVDLWGFGEPLTQVPSEQRKEDFIGVLYLCKMAIMRHIAMPSGGGFHSITAPRPHPARDDTAVEPVRLEDVEALPEGRSFALSVL